MDIKDNSNRLWRLARRPQVMIEDDTFELVTSSIPEPQDGEFLVRNYYLSLAPIMRAYVIDGGVVEKPLEIGATMRGRAVGIIVKSRHPDYAPGEVVHGPFGWQDYATSNGQGRVYRLRNRAGSISAALGALGLTGFTAYFGLLDKGQPKPGDQVLVSGAVGGVGSVTGQIARIKGCHVVALCGTEEKCAFAVDKLGYHKAINYRTENVRQRVEELFKNGIDVYFDNVGGDTLEIAIDNMANDGRIVVCGAISQYTADNGKPIGPSNYFEMVYKNVSMLGFHIYQYRDRYPEAETKIAEWINQGLLINLEDRMEGLHMMPKALIGLFEGDNFGKRVVKIADEFESDKLAAGQN